MTLWDQDDPPAFATGWKGDGDEDVSIGESESEEDGRGACMMDSGEDGAMSSSELDVGKEERRRRLSNLAKKRRKDGGASGGEDGDVRDGEHRARLPLAPAARNSREHGARVWGGAGRRLHSSSYKKVMSENHRGANSPAGSGSEAAVLPHGAQAGPSKEGQQRRGLAIRSIPPLVRNLSVTGEAADPEAPGVERVNRASVNGESSGALRSPSKVPGALGPVKRKRSPVVRGGTDNDSLDKRGQKRRRGWGVSISLSGDQESAGLGGNLDSPKDGPSHSQSPQGRRRGLDESPTPVGSSMTPTGGRAGRRWPWLPGGEDASPKDTEDVDSKQCGRAGAKELQKDLSVERSSSSSWTGRRVCAEDLVECSVGNGGSPGGRHVGDDTEEHVTEAQGRSESNTRAWHLPNQLHSRVRKTKDMQSVIQGSDSVTTGDANPGFAPRILCPIDRPARMLHSKQDESITSKEGDGKLPSGAVVWAKITEELWWPGILMSRAGVPPDVPHDLLERTGKGPKPKIVKFFGFKRASDHYESVQRSCLCLFVSGYERFKDGDGSKGHREAVSLASMYHQKTSCFESVQKDVCDRSDRRTLPVAGPSQDSLEKNTAHLKGSSKSSDPALMSSSHHLAKVADSGGASSGSRAEFQTLEVQALATGPPPSSAIGTGTSLSGSLAGPPRQISLLGSEAVDCGGGPSSSPLTMEPHHGASLNLDNERRMDAGVAGSPDGRLSDHEFPSIQTGGKKRSHSQIKGSLSEGEGLRARNKNIVLETGANSAPTGPSLPVSSQREDSPAQEVELVEGAAKSGSLDVCKDTRIMQAPEGAAPAVVEVVDATRMCTDADAVKTKGTSSSPAPDVGETEDLGPVDEHNDICEKCGLRGDLLCCGCKGCKTTYHLGCAVPPVAEKPVGNWYCPECQQRRLSAHIFDGVEVESIWRVKEAKSLSVIDPKSQSAAAAVLVNGERHGSKENLSGAGVEVLGCDTKEYFVKWSGYAHVYNSWVQEAELIKLAPKKLSSYKRKAEQGKSPNWNEDWVVPERLLAHKESRGAGLRHESVCGLGGGGAGQWLVKWKGLGYDCCTWEPSDTGVLANKVGEDLALKFNKVTPTGGRQGETGGANEVEKELGPIERFSVQPEWDGVRWHCEQVEVLEKLMSRWNLKSNCVLSQDACKERTVTALTFVLSLLRAYPNAKPVLIVLPSKAIPSWEKELSQIAPEAHAVTYTGSQLARDVIQRYEFNYVGGGFKPRIVFTTFEIARVDSYLRDISWEALLADDGYTMVKGANAENTFDLFRTGFRLLFSHEPLKKEVEDLLQIVTFLQHVEAENCHQRCTDLDDKQQKDFLFKLLCEFIVSPSEKLCPSDFQLVEHWVPVEMSKQQVEQYCETLLKNYLTLLDGRIQGEKLPAFREIVTELHLCSAHPFATNASRVDGRDLVGEGLLMDTIQASGKLRLLDMMLMNLQSKRRKVVIMVSSKAVMRILEDYMRQRFGPDSFELVNKPLGCNDNGAAVKRFNEPESGCFAVLLAASMCGKVDGHLTNVDIGIIFQAGLTSFDAATLLQRTLQSKKLAVFRLYTRLSVEEGMLASVRGKPVTERLVAATKPISAKLCQQILRWGAKELFEILKGNFSLTGEHRIAFTAEKVCLLLAENREICVEDQIEPQLLSCILTNRAVESEACQQSIMYGLHQEDPFTEDIGPAKKFWSALLKDEYVELQSTGKMPWVKKSMQYKDDTLASIGQSPAAGDDGGDEQNTRKSFHLDHVVRGTLPVSPEGDSMPRTVHPEQFEGSPLGHPLEGEGNGEGVDCGAAVEGLPLSSTAVDPRQVPGSEPQQKKVSERLEEEEGQPGCPPGEPSNITPMIQAEEPCGSLHVEQQDAPTSPLQKATAAASHSGVYDTTGCSQMQQPEPASLSFGQQPVTGDATRQPSSCQTNPHPVEAAPVGTAVASHSGANDCEGCSQVQQPKAANSLPGQQLAAAGDASCQSSACQTNEHPVEAAPLGTEILGGVRQEPSGRPRPPDWLAGMSMGPSCQLEGIQLATPEQQETAVKQLIDHQTEEDKRFHDFVQEARNKLDVYYQDALDEVNKLADKLHRESYKKILMQGYDCELSQFTKCEREERHKLLARQKAARNDLRSKIRPAAVLPPSPTQAAETGLLCGPVSSLNPGSAANRSPSASQDAELVGVSVTSVAELRQHQNILQPQSRANVQSQIQRREQAEVQTLVQAAQTRGPQCEVQGQLPDQARRVQGHTPGQFVASTQQMQAEARFHQASTSQVQVQTVHSPTQHQAQQDTQQDQRARQVQVREELQTRLGQQAQHQQSQGLTVNSGHRTEGLWQAQLQVQSDRQQAHAQQLHAFVQSQACVQTQQHQALSQVQQMAEAQHLAQTQQRQFQAGLHPNQMVYVQQAQTLAQQLQSQAPLPSQLHVWADQSNTECHTQGQQSQAHMPGQAQHASTQPAFLGQQAQQVAEQVQQQTQPGQQQRHRQWQQSQPQRHQPQQGQQQQLGQQGQQQQQRHQPQQGQQQQLGQQVQQVHQQQRHQPQHGQQQQLGQQGQQQQQRHQPQQGQQQQLGQQGQQQLGQQGQQQLGQQGQQQLGQQGQQQRGQQGQQQRGQQGQQQLREQVQQQRGQLGSQQFQQPHPQSQLASQQALQELSHAHALAQAQQEVQHLRQNGWAAQRSTPMARPDVHRQPAPLQQSLLPQAHAQGMQRSIFNSGRQAEPSLLGLPPLATHQIANSQASSAQISPGAASPHQGRSGVESMSFVAGLLRGQNSGSCSPAVTQRGAASPGQGQSPRTSWVSHMQSSGAGIPNGNTGVPSAGRSVGGAMQAPGVSVMAGPTIQAPRLPQHQSPPMAMRSAAELPRASPLGTTSLAQPVLYGDGGGGQPASSAAVHGDTSAGPQVSAMATSRRVIPLAIPALNPSTRAALASGAAPSIMLPMPRQATATPASTIAQVMRTTPDPLLHEEARLKKRMVDEEVEGSVQEAALRQTYLREAAILKTKYDKMIEDHNARSNRKIDQMKDAVSKVDNNRQLADMLRGKMLMEQQAAQSAQRRAAQLAEIRACGQSQNGSPVGQVGIPLPHLRPRPAAGVLAPEDGRIPFGTGPAIPSTLAPAIGTIIASPGHTGGSGLPSSRAGLTPTVAQANPLQHGRPVRAQGSPTSQPVQSVLRSRTQNSPLRVGMPQESLSPFSGQNLQFLGNCAPRNVVPGVRPGAPAGVSPVPPHVVHLSQAPLSWRTLTATGPATHGARTSPGLPNQPAGLGVGTRSPSAPSVSAAPNSALAATTEVLLGRSNRSAYVNIPARFLGEGEQWGAQSPRGPSAPAPGPAPGPGEPIRTAAGGNPAASSTHEVIDLTDDD